MAGARHIVERSNTFAKRFLKDRAKTLPAEKKEEPPLTGDAGLAQSLSELKAARARIKGMKSK